MTDPSTATSGASTLDRSAATENWGRGFVATNGIDLHYYRTGNEGGPTLVLAHGLYDDGRCWAPLANAFADRFDVVAYDARGHGRSDKTPDGYAVNDRIADLRGLVDGLGIHDPILVGHSFGGNTVAATAATYPDLPHALVLEDPAGMLGWVDDQPVDAQVAAVEAQIETWHGRTDAALRASFDHPRWADHLLDARRAVSLNVAEVRRAGYVDPAETFPSIRCPTLVLRADVSEARRRADRAAVDLLADGRLRHVDGAGHCIRRDRFDVVRTAIESFLDEVVG